MRASLGCCPPSSSIHDQPRSQGVRRRGRHPTGLRRPAAGHHHHLRPRPGLHSGHLPGRTTARHADTTMRHQFTGDAEGSSSTAPRRHDHHPLLYRKSCHAQRRPPSPRQRHGFRHVRRRVAGHRSETDRSETRLGARPLPVSAWRLTLIRWSPVFRAECWTPRARGATGCRRPFSLGPHPAATAMSRQWVSASHVVPALSDALLAHVVATRSFRTGVTLRGRMGSR